MLLFVMLRHAPFDGTVVEKLTFRVYVSPVTFNVVQLVTFMLAKTGVRLEKKNNEAKTANRKFCSFLKQ